jgi:hypothetical protein
VNKFLGVPTSNRDDSVQLIEQLPGQSLERHSYVLVFRIPRLTCYSTVAILRNTGRDRLDCKYDKRSFESSNSKLSEVLNKLCSKHTIPKLVSLPPLTLSMSPRLGASAAFCYF